MYDTSRTAQVLNMDGTIMIPGDRLRQGKCPSRQPAGIAGRAVLRVVFFSFIETPKPATSLCSSAWKRVERTRISRR